MAKSPTAIAYLDGPRMLRAISAGIRHVFTRRDYLNRINVFPVPDGDTGTNMAFTFKTILESSATAQPQRVDALMRHIADAALDGARGNSGAIMAQYFHGFSDSVSGCRLLTAADFSRASVAGARAAWSAMSKPVAGTLPTVLDDFSAELAHHVSTGVQDFRALIKAGLDRARRSLANTPNQLPALRQAGVVDAGGQGFVDLLEGIWAFVESGEMDEVTLEMGLSAPLEAANMEAADHRYCTECLIEGARLDRDAVMRRIETLDSSSLVVAGGRERIRVHVHVNNPGELFLLCEEFGTITQQKADDMHRQHGLMNQPGQVAVVVDSGADIPPAEIDRLGINLVPVRLSFGDREYLDRVSITSAEFYAMLAESAETPLTSQPPTQDFSRIYTLLTSHGYDVVSVGLSAQLSGTIEAARQAARRQPDGRVEVFDTRSASAGQGLLAMLAAEAAERGFNAAEILALLEEAAPLTRVMAITDDLAWAVKGGRVPAWVHRLTRLLQVNPLLTASREGKISLGGIHRGTRARPQALARSAAGKMKPDIMYRIIIAHANHPEGAVELRKAVLKLHGRIHSCHVTEAGPALGVHLGPGGLIIGFVPQPEALN